MIIYICILLDSLSVGDFIEVSIILEGIKFTDIRVCFFCALFYERSYMFKQLLDFRDNGGFKGITDLSLIKKIAEEINEIRRSTKHFNKQILMRLEIVFVGAYGDILCGRFVALEIRNRELNELLPLLLDMQNVEGGNVA